MEFSSLKPKKLLIFQVRITKFVKQTRKPAQSSFLDVFSIFTTVQHRESPCEANVM